MMTKTERMQIRSILQAPQWVTVEKVAADLCAAIQNDPVVGVTEWETLKTALLNEGQVRGIKRLLKEMYEAAKYD